MTECFIFSVSSHTTFSFPSSDGRRRISAVSVSISTEVKVPSGAYVLVTVFVFLNFPKSNLTAIMTPAMTASPATTSTTAMMIKAFFIFPVFLPFG